MASFFPIPFKILNLEFPVKVVRGCREREIIGPSADGTMTIRILSTIVNRAAVEEIRAALARHYNVSDAAVELVSGNGSAGIHARIAVHHESVAQVRAKPPQAREEIPAHA